MTANSVSLSATGTSTPTGTGHALGIGLASLAGSSVNATDTSSAVAYIGPKEGTFSSGVPANVTANSVDVEASMTTHVLATNDSTSIGILFTGALTSASATAKPTSEAYLGDQAQVDSQSGDTTFRAVTVGDAIANSTGVGVSLGVSVGGTSVTSDLEPTAKAFSTGGGYVGGHNITFNARVNVDSGGNGISPTYNSQTVTPAFGALTLANVGLIGGATGGVLSETDSPVLVTKIAGGTHIDATGAVTIQSQSFSPADADGESLAGGLVFGAGIIAPSVTTGGSVTTSFDGVVDSAGSVSIRSDVQSKATVTGQAASVGLAAGVTDATLQATMSPNVTTSVGGQITASGNITVLSSVFTSVYAAHEAEQFSLGVATGSVTVNADDKTSVNTEVGGSASLTSTGGTVKVLAYHNFDGTSFTSDDVQANSEALSVALLASLGIDETHMHSTAESTVTAQVDGGGTIAAPSGAVILKSMSSNAANAHMQNAGGAILNVSVGSNPTATAQGTTTANFYGNVVGAGSTIGAQSLTILAEGTNYANAGMKEDGGGALSIGDSSATSQGSPNTTASVGGGGSVILTQGDINGQALGLSDSDASSTSFTIGILLQVGNFTASATMNPSVSFTVNAGASITSQSGTITFDATHGQAPPAASDGTFNAGSQVDPSNGSGGNSITFSAAHNLSTGNTITYSTNGNPAIGGLTPTRSYTVVVTSSTRSSSVTR